jgi:NTE family protein
MPVLVLQGGGALGSYQAGVFAGLDDMGYCPKAVAGISIGAINGALIAGNPPERRRERLMTFWERVTGSPGLNFLFPPGIMMAEMLRHQWAAAGTAVWGAPGFFRPRWPWQSGSQTALYDTTPLRDSLNELVDWDYLNGGPVRLAVGAVNVETGNFRYFCSAQQRLDVRHVMASGALPPGLPEVEERAADIRFSSRTRFTTDAQARLNGPREAWSKLAARLPAELRDSAEAKLLDRLARGRRAVVAQLVYRDQPWQGAAKGREFSRDTMQVHWRQGVADVAAMLERRGWAGLPTGPGVWSFDATAQP